MLVANFPSLIYRPRFLIACLAGLYFLWCAWDPSHWHLIDGVNLLIHEAGHFLFMPFGKFLMIAGGSLLQLIMPAAFVLYFYYNRASYSAAIVLFWAGESLLNVSVYANDAIKMELPLLGGQDSMHDWNYLLTTMGVLSSAAMIAGVIRLIGTVVIMTGLGWAINEARKD